ncbi:MAG: thioredoxin family protein [Bacteroidota bacterium]|nr:thioredoxin family protein [Bacteroidota bacterium]
MIKKILPFLFMILLAALLIFGLAMKNRINNSLSEILQEQASPEIMLSSEALIDSLYNYEEKNSTYDITFLEFGSKGCSACKRMEGVLDEIRQKYAGKVNIVFIDVLLPESQKLMKYYGIAAIPTQILLDKQGNEYFRHTGFIPSDELEREFYLKN